MTFNIRYGSAEDGINAWSNRMELVAEIIRREAPDVLAIQEGLAFQLDDLAEALVGYEKLGQHREGGLEGEFSGLYVSRERLRVLDWGELWLSPMPDSVGSRGWDAALPRMAVWAEVRTSSGAGPIRVYGTHFDHRGETARLESARLLAQHARGGSPSVVMGDLNAPEDSPPLSLLFSEGYRSAVLSLHPDVQLGTFNGFRDPAGGQRIDHVMVGPGLEAVRAEILYEHRGDLWPSDHFPVVAEVARVPAR
jgi:endonuclease/exonuclease/phosphatase family metal-dependent hydrolase